MPHFFEPESWWLVIYPLNWTVGHQMYHYIKNAISPALEYKVKKKNNMKERTLFLGINNWLIEKLVSYFWLSLPHTIPQRLSKIDSPNCKAEDWPVGEKTHEQAPVSINPPTIALPEEDAGWDLKWLSTQEGRLGI